MNPKSQFFSWEDIMIIEKIVAALPFEFYITVLAATALYFIWMTIQLILTRSRVRRLQYDFYNIEDAIRMHQGCHIENLPLISEIFESAPRKLTYAYDKMIQVSIDFHQKRWIPNPEDFITADSVLDKKTSQRVKGFGFLYFSFSGLFLTFATVVAELLILNTPDQINACIILSLLPLSICLLFTILFFVEKLQNMASVENSIKSLVQILSRKLPVFNDYNGLALLINQFLDYDRNMTKSVERFTEQIEHFVMDGLTNAVTASIEKTLLESVAPSIERATNAISTLSIDVIEKENTGMKDLALKFSTALSSELSYQFEPLVKQICDVANTLSNSKGYLDVASKTLDTYTQNAIDLQALTSKTLVEYESSKAAFSDDIHSLSGSLAQFNQASRTYDEKTLSNQQQFEAATVSLKESMEEGHKSLQLLLDGIFVEARNAEEQAHTSQKANENYLDIMKTQIDAFTGEFSTHNKEFFDMLSATISDFLNRQSGQISDRQKAVDVQTVEILRSME